MAGRFERSGDRKPIKREYDSRDRGRNRSPFRGGRSDGANAMSNRNDGGRRMDAFSRNDEYNNGYGASEQMGQQNAHGGGDYYIPQVPETCNKKKFTARCRLFIGNLTKETTEPELKELFKSFGEISECFISDKGFGFITLDTRYNAGKAKEEVDGITHKGRTLRVRLAQHQAAVRVKELPPYASNELLYEAFSQFGDVERAVHIVDDKGRPTGEGIVEFQRRPGMNECMRRIESGVFLLTSSLKPVIAEHVEARDEEDGLAERMIPKNPLFYSEREQMPRFAQHGNFDYEYGMRWKQVFADEREKRAALDKEFQERRDRLEQEMELAFQEYQADMLREDLRRRQEELDRLDRSRSERLDALKQFRGEDTNGRFGGGGMGSAPNTALPPPPFIAEDGRKLGGYGAPPASMEDYSSGAKSILQSFNDHSGGGKQSALDPYAAGGRGGGDHRGSTGGAREHDRGSRYPYDETEGGHPDDNMMFRGGGDAGLQGPQDETLVHGVHKLLQMFQDPASQGGMIPEQLMGGNGGMPPSSMNSDFFGAGMGEMDFGGGGYDFNQPPPTYGATPMELQGGGRGGGKRRRR